MRRTLCVFSLLLLTLRLLSAAALTGKVVDEGGKPVAGAQVWVELNLYDGQKLLDLCSAATGEYSIDADPKLLWPGSPRGWIRAYAPGYALTGARFLEESGNVIVLHPGASISGIVVDANGKPQAGVPVTLDYCRDPDYQVATVPDSWRPPLYRPLHCRRRLDPARRSTGGRGNT